MTKSGLAAICLTAIFLIAGESASSTTGKYAVIIGNNEGVDPAQRLKYAQRDAEKMYAVLTELGSFAPENTRLILGKSADAAWNALEEMEQLARRRSRQTGQKTILLVYYSGHAEGDSLEMGKTTLGFSRLRKFLEKSAMDVRLAFIDSCHSGKIIAAKGGRRGPEYRIDVTDRITSTGYAIITSSAHNELSQESAELRGAFFTHYLVSALRGSGDDTGDGSVTLQEAYKYAYSRTLARTSATVGGSQHPMYHFQLEGQGDIVLTRPKKTKSHIQITSVEEGRLLLLDGAGETILAEALIDERAPAFLSVPAGTYLLYLVNPEGNVRRADVTVRTGNTTAVDHADFHSTELRDAVAKGGVFTTPELRYQHQIGLGAMYRSWPLQGGDISYGFSVNYRHFGPFPFQPSARLQWTTAPDNGVSTNYNEIGILAGIGHRWEEHPPVGFRVEFLAGYSHFFQDPLNGIDRHTSGFNYLASVGLEVPAANFVFSIDTGAGGRIFQIIDRGWVHRLDFQAILSVGYQWGTR